MPMTLVSTVTAGSGGATQFEFASIPQTGKDLLLLASLRTDTSAGGVVLRFNGSTSGYANRLLQGTGTGVSSYTNLTTGGFLGDTSNSSNTTNAFGLLSTYIPNYAIAAAKSYNTDHVSENSGSAANQWIIASSWSSASAITSMVITPQSANNFIQNSVISLYIIS